MKNIRHMTYQMALDEAQSFFAYLKEQESFVELTKRAESLGLSLEFYPQFHTIIDYGRVLPLHMDKLEERLPSSLAMDCNVALVKSGYGIHLKGELGQECVYSYPLITPISTLLGGAHHVVACSYAFENNPSIDLFEDYLDDIEVQGFEINPNPSAGLSPAFCEGIQLSKEFFEGALELLKEGEEGLYGSPAMAFLVTLMKGHEDLYKTFLEDLDEKENWEFYLDEVLEYPYVVPSVYETLLTNLTYDRMEDFEEDLALIQEWLETHPEALYE